MKTEKGDLSKTWEVCEHFIYNKEYIEGLEEFIKQRGAKRILDCACGAGFPTIELAKRGYNILFSDGSMKMLKLLHRRSKREGIDIPFIRSRWDQLDKIFNNEFDMVLMTGNSIPYADSWWKDSISPEKSLEKIKDSLKSIRNILKKNGVLVIATIHKNEFKVKNGKIIKNFNKRNISGKEVSLALKITHQRDQKIRIYRPEVSYWRNGRVEKKFYFNMMGYLLEHDELVSLLKESGFFSVEKYVKVKGEDNYDVFVARK